MQRDSRGGHNRKSVNERFFETWSPQMAYVLGLIFADGAVEDVRQSSRTCYLQLSNKDKDLLEQVKASLSSNHHIYEYKPQSICIHGRMYYRSETYYLRIGNKVMYQDLIDKGLTPRKSLKLRFPGVPEDYFRFYLRGYFDGDGCVNVYVPKGRSKSVIQVVFICGTLEFLERLAKHLISTTGVSHKNISRNSRAFRLSYKNNEARKLLRFMYKQLDKAPYLARKYEIYRSFIEPHQL